MLLLQRGRRTGIAFGLGPALTPSSVRGVAVVPATVDLLERYRGLVATGQVEYDEGQVRVIMRLRSLSRALHDYTPPGSVSRYFQPSRSAERGESGNDTAFWWSPSHLDEAALDQTRALVRTRSHAEELAALDTPKGLLVTGPPGCGKSFLVDLWFSTVPTAHKVRRHYSEFVIEIFRGVWEETQRRMAHASAVGSNIPAAPSVPWTRPLRDRWRELVQAGKLPQRWTPTPSLRASTTDPPISYVLARRLILRHWLLVFDEVQLLDVASAGLLSETLSWFWRMGGVVVGTSNSLPEDMYAQGTQRERLEPFLEALRARCPVIEASGRDWREVKAAEDGPAEGRKTWFVGRATEQLEEALRRATGGEPSPTQETLSVFRREVRVPWSCRGVCKFTFDELCNESLGAADYITLASTYHTLALTDIPVLTLASKDRARRFITLIDALYERRCRLICTAQAEPTALFFPVGPSSDAQGAADLLDALTAEAFTEGEVSYRPNVSAYDTPTTIDAEGTGNERMKKTALNDLSIFSGIEKL